MYAELSMGARKKTNLKQWLLQILRLIHWNYENEIMLLIPHILLLNKSMLS